MAKSLLRQRVEALPLFQKIFARHRGDIAVLVDRLREERGLSKIELAQAADVKPSYLSRILHGSGNITLRTIAKLEAALDAAIISIPSFEESTQSSTSKGPSSIRIEIRSMDHNITADIDALRAVIESIAKESVTSPRGEATYESTSQLQPNNVIVLDENKMKEMRVAA